MTKRVGILFLQSQERFAADSAVHADIVRNLDRDKFDVHVACPRPSGAGPSPSLSAFERIPDIRLRLTRFVPSLGRADARALKAMLTSSLAFSADFVALRRYISRERIRIIHSTERPRDAVYNVSLAKLTGAKSAVHVHVKWSDEFSKSARWGVQAADAVFSISRYVTRTLCETGKPEADIYTVLNGIDTSIWDPELDGSELRRELGIASDALVLASVSRLFSWKGQRELLKAFALLRGDFPTLKLLVVGADDLEVQPASFSAELKELARTLGIQQDVLFTGPRSDVARIMAACDIFTLPSFEEPFGLVFVEAMLMQKPVVGIDNGGTPEVVEHGRTGLLSPPWEVPALAANIRTLLQSPELRAQMGQRGRTRALEHFTAKRMATDVGVAYERILSRSSA